MVLVLTSYRNFIPDSGQLIHLRTPRTTDTVRIDAGFVAGDNVSSHYDPMIAKLIIQGPDRTSAIQKLHAALEDYEIAGLISNVEFLKKVCQHPSFIDGEVETGFIPKHREELFRDVLPSPEVYAQAAIGTMLKEVVETAPQGLNGLGFSSSNFQNRSFHFKSVDGNTKQGANVNVEVKQSSADSFVVSVNGTTTYTPFRSNWDPASRTLTSFFPHTRLETRLITSENNLTMFQQGSQYRLQYSTPAWLEKALGTKEVANSVLAPMPCKVLRVEVKEGDKVKKDQPLVVLEAMKMEMVLRSPQDGTVARIVHKQGVSDLLKQRRNDN